MNIDPVFTFPEPEEMDLRLARVRAEMIKLGLDYYVAQCPDNVFYLTNFANYVHERPFIIIIPITGRLKFIVPKLEIPHVTARKVGEVDLVEYFEFPAPAGRTWADRFKDQFQPGGRVGVESICPLQVYEEVPGTTVRTDIVDDVRQVKTAFEISRIKYSSDLAVEGLGSLLANARPGRTLMDVSSSISGQMMLQALKDMPNTNMLCSKVAAVFQPPEISDDPHNFTDINVAMTEGGPHVCIINGTINGYGTEVERTFFLGHVPEVAKKPYEVMMEARAKAYELAVPGNVMHDVDEAVNNVLKKAGYEDNLLHRTGHSIGVTGHEAPFLAEGYHREIEPGMFFTIEPGIYLPGVGGFRHSDTVMTTDKGNVSMTPMADSLEEMTLPIKE
ncbi:aminopeptidase P family protein [Pseudomaricurvus alkylphenolicus]|uniref:M24 family metallopeptidase n=1 Tax=Pseudomaricurvus alkylphenolicus TaxID=1306991 RepID=UPI001422CB72|nr:Xaa-Pro peptidase family protein [Pseudomaricurvus alkylphenolicus]NIB38147.1 aminopeptidase P family protein [Pseudomaricurvus alkylphenolicus]